MGFFQDTSSEVTIENVKSGGIFGTEWQCV